MRDSRPARRRHHETVPPIRKPDITRQVAWIIRRCRVSPETALVLSELAGIGGKGEA